MFAWINRLDHYFPIRYAAWALCIVGFVASAVRLVRRWAWARWLGDRLRRSWSLVGLRDVLQTRHAVLRNYPVIGHLRFLLEFIRPEMRQYFIESDREAAPFSRQQRSLVYQRAKGDSDKRPFGTQMDVGAIGYEWINHSMQPTVLTTHDFRVLIGAGRAQPYSASIFNISAMSFGALSANAILALNAGAKRGNFAHDTGEGSISRHHRVHGGDLIWEIGSGYFGCCNDDGSFSEERFAANARDPQVKMIELKLSQGAKPGHGGVLPGPKVTLEIAEARGVQPWVDCVSPASHGAFRTPIEMMHFIERLRELSGGKPTGFKLCIGHPWEWFAHRQGDARDRHHARLHRRRRRRGRHRRGAARVHRPRRRAAAGRPAAGPQHAGRPRPARAASSSAAPARSSAPSTSRACSRSAPTGATRRAASCSRSAASRRRPATPATARPA